MENFLSYVNQKQRMEGGSIIAIVVWYIYIYISLPFNASCLYVKCVCGGGGGGGGGGGVGGGGGGGGHRYSPFAKDQLWGLRYIFWC